MQGWTGFIWVETGRILSDITAGYLILFVLDIFYHHKVGCQQKSIPPMHGQLQSAEVLQAIEFMIYKYCSLKPRSIDTDIMCVNMFNCLYLHICLNSGFMSLHFKYTLYELLGGKESFWFTSVQIFNLLLLKAISSIPTPHTHIHKKKNQEQK